MVLGLKPVLLALSVAAPDASAPESGCAAAQWRLAYQHDERGEPLAGSKQALFDAVRRGQPIRLAWGFAIEREGRRIALEHAAEPDFVTVMGGQELVAQLPEHVAQASYHDPEAATFDRGHLLWRGLLRTSGVFDALFVDRGTGREVRRLPQRARIAWFALAPEAGCAPRPVDLAVPGGVRLRERSDHPVPAPAWASGDAALDRTLDELWLALSHQPGAGADASRLQALFHPDARVLGAQSVAGMSRVDVRTAAAFVEAQARPQELGFFEREIHREVRRSGAFAQVYSTVESRHDPNAAEPLFTGVNSLQLHRGEDGRWQILSLYYALEDSGPKGGGPAPRN